MNKLSNPAFRLISLLCLALLAPACATSVSKDVNVSRDDLAKYDTMTPEEALDSYKSMVDGASQSGMSFLAPNHFKEASEILKKATKDVEKKRRKKTIVSGIIKGENIVNKGQRVMLDVSKRLSQELKIKASLEKINVPGPMQKEYNSAMSGLSKLIEKIELDKGSIDKDQARLLTRLQALEINTIKYYALNEAKSILQEVEDNKGKKLIPVSYNEAVNTYQTADNKISANTSNEQQVKVESARALFAAKHAKAVLEQLSILQKQYKESPENVILAEENRLMQIGAALNHEDVRDQTLEQQARLLASAARSLAGSKDQQTKISEQLSQTQTTIDSLTGDNEKLKAEISKKDEQLVRLSAQIIQLESELKDTITRADQVVVMSAKIIQLDEKIKQQEKLIEQLKAE